jgi:hypothetical protein
MLNKFFTTCLEQYVVLHPTGWKKVRHKVILIKSRLSGSLLLVSAFQQLKIQAIAETPIVAALPPQTLQNENSCDG